MENDEMHIQDQVTAELLATGWKRPGDDWRFTKSLPTGGTFGKAICTLIMDESGRWLEAIDGWGTVISQVDLRKFPNGPKEAIASATHTNFPHPSR